MSLQIRSIVGCLTKPKNIGWKSSKRSVYYKFERVYTPPLPAPKESPYIVGPYLKPDYVPQKYYTEPIRSRFDDHLNYFIYKPTEIVTDESRTVKLLLIKDVEGLGVAGQIVDAPYRLGASRLVAMRQAEYATELTLKKYTFGPKSYESASSALSPRTARLLRSQIFKLPISQNVVVKSWHISLALRLSGCICPVETIDESSICDKDDHIECIIRINNHEKINVKFKFNKQADD